jgi:hypothetical protein
MAQASLTATKLLLVFEVGMDKDGKTIYKTKSLNNIRTNATADQLSQTAQALGVLCNDPLQSVGRTDSLDIIA